ncbi:hypothetical protein F5Y05DRAFT_362028 [Hypoxylon sp. FL0543]|nr:hypothetical protein F5Y05DRAFT_362028 [Hypoxylon sp. FL0543]
MEGHGPVFPLEIFRLVCIELAERGDARTLFKCCLLSRGIAQFACRELYSSQEIDETDPFTSRPGYIQSIILSASGKTAFPYCTYLLALSLQDLENYLLRKVGADLSPEMVMTGTGTARVAQPEIEHGNSIFGYIKKYADDNEKAVALIQLELSFNLHFPRGLLPSWIARLGVLKSLTIRESSALDVDVAKAICEHCPHFYDLVYEITPGYSVDPKLCAFLETLRPNRLQDLTLSWRTLDNVVPKEALTGLNTHATSLRTLQLNNISIKSMRALGSLAACTALNALCIRVISSEGDESQRTDTTDRRRQKLGKVISWICACKSLKALEFERVEDVFLILESVLKSPDIRLERLLVLDFHPLYNSEDGATWSALRLQDQLKCLMMVLNSGHYHHGNWVHRMPGLVDSIYQLKNLTSLVFGRMKIRKLEIKGFTKVLPKLSKFYILAPNFH